MSASVLAMPEAEYATSQADPQPRRWTRDEYYRAAKLGIFRPNERLELIDGEIIEKVSPIGSPHRTAVYRISHKLEAIFGPGFYVDAEVPLTLSDEAEPEPDIWVVIGSVDDYEDHHPGPADTRLVVEVSDSTVAYDRGKKALLYAKAGIPEYWIINLPARRLEVYQDPSDDIGYRTVTELTDADAVTPLAAPDASIRIADLLPRKR